MYDNAFLVRRPIQFLFFDGGRRGAARLAVAGRGACGASGERGGAFGLLLDLPLASPAERSFTVAESSV